MSARRERAARARHGRTATRAREPPSADAARRARSIEEDYRVHWVMDNLPSATKYVDETNPAKPVTIYDLGFPLGFKGE